MPRVVALVSSEPHEELVRYLESVGFDVRAFRSPLGAPREGTLVNVIEVDPVTEHWAHIALQRMLDLPGKSHRD